MYHNGCITEGYFTSITMLQERPWPVNKKRFIEFEGIFRELCFSNTRTIYIERQPQFYDPRINHSLNNQDLFYLQDHISLQQSQE